MMYNVKIAGNLDIFKFLHFILLSIFQDVFEFKLEFGVMYIEF